MKAGNMLDIIVYNEIFGTAPSVAKNVTKYLFS